MKFLHLSDIRIGSSAESGTLWEEARLQEIGGGLTRAMEEAVRQGAGLVLVSGGLFSHVPTSAELNEAADIFASYAGIQVVIIAGETDPIRKSSPVLSFIWPENVHYCLTAKPERIVLPQLHTEVIASSVTDFEQSDESAIAAAANVSFPDVQPIRLAVFRTEDDEKTAAVLGGNQTPLSYLAAGSRLPGCREITASIRCPGFFEPEAMGDNGQHGCLMVSVSEETGALESVEFLPMASASYIPLVVRTNVKTTAAEVGMLVEREVVRRGANNIYRLKIVGSRNPEEVFDLEALKTKYRISEILDETEPEYDFRELFAEHPQDMIGFYIAKIVNDKHEMSPVEKKAMFYGLDALIRTADE